MRDYILVCGQTESVYKIKFNVCFFYLAKKVRNQLPLSQFLLTLLIVMSASKMLSALCGTSAHDLWKLKVQCV